MLGLWTHPVLDLVKKVSQHDDDVKEDDAEPDRHRREVAEDGGGGDFVEAVLHGQVGDHARVVGHRPAEYIHHLALHFDGRQVNLKLEIVCANLI